MASTTAETFANSCYSSEMKDVYVCRTTRWSVMLMLHAEKRKLNRKKNHIYAHHIHMCIEYGAFERFILRAAFKLPLSVSQFIESICVLFFFVQSTHTHASMHPTLSDRFSIYLQNDLWAVVHGIRCCNCCEWSTVSNSFASMEFHMSVFVVCYLLGWMCVCVALVFQINFPSFTVSRWKIRFVSMFPEKTLLRNVFKAQAANWYRWFCIPRNSNADS